MRYPKEHNKEARERILTVASRLFREQGIEAVGLAKIMAEADLTVGTFYTHFKSKEDLLRAAILCSLDARHVELSTALQGADIEHVVRAYLSPEHRDNPGEGCPVATLASEVSRHPRATKTTFASHNRPTLDAIATWLSSQRNTKVTRADAAAVLGLLSGTLQLARATPDRVESDDILEAGVRAAMRLVK